ncbi:hypothetical protein [Sulfitobacter sp. S190]|uniref:hypothetical protein n=1 Tax=Sulfitobacter sp. S190 TaxID=2867022 RepID=UPI0021A7FC0A|nr:hypothetical protein [Sulfitobacter sp. S190]UWR23169.1 hypothetical protein K3756_04015 [Sulfitobacter sp. S190]
MTPDTLRRIFASLPRQVDAHPHLHRLGALFSHTVLIDVDDMEFYLHFEKGHLLRVSEGPSRKTPWRFAFFVDAQALAAFWQPLPAPGFHDLFGLAKIGRARIGGDILCLVRNLRFFKEVMALPRPAPEAPTC